MKNKLTPEDTEKKTNLGRTENKLITEGTIRTD
jgi:hypothetical protein